jgi:hypothetical protein
VAGSAWTNQLVDLIILSAAAAGFSGFFTYSPAPGTGNLIGSVAAASGVDPYGNNYLQGTVTYGSGFASSLNGGFLVLWSGSLSGGWTQVATIETDVSGDLILVCSGGGSIQLDSNAVAGSDFTVDGTLFVGGASGGSITATNFNMNPTMGTPPNLAAINGGTATAAQICAFLSTWYAEFQNRGLAT